MIDTEPKFGPQEPERFSRRELFKRAGKTAIAAGAVAALGPSIAHPQEVTARALDGGDPSVEITDELVLLENFQDYTPEAMIEAVKNNIETFKKVDVDNLMLIGESTKAKARIQGYGDIQAPIIDPDPESQEARISYFISSPEQDKEFPNLAVISGNTVFEGDRKSTILYLQGVYLGRTVHPFEDPNFKADVGYFGMYIGDPKSRVTRIVLPVFLGVRSLDGEIESFMYSIKSDVDSEPPSAPFSTSGIKPSLSDALQTLDEIVGKGTTLLQIDSAEIPPIDLPDQAQTFGLPRGPYEIDYINREIETTLETRKALQNITIKRAEEAGYVLNSIVGNESPEPTPVATVYPSIDEIDIKAEQKKLANYKKYLNTNELSSSDTVLLPRVMSLLTIPTSKSITT